MKTDKLIPAIGIALVLFALVAGAKKSEQPKPASTPEITNEEVILRCVNTAQEHMPGQVDYEWDKTRDTLTLFIWDDAIKPAGVKAKSGDAEARALWDQLVSAQNSLCNSLQSMVYSAGYGTTVALFAVDPENHDLVYLAVSKDKVLYDATTS